MRVPLSWLREYVPVEAPLALREEVEHARQALGRDALTRVAHRDAHGRGRGAGALAAGSHDVTVGNPDPAAIQAAHRMGVPAVELHTGRYAHTWRTGGAALGQLRDAAGYAAGQGTPSKRWEPADVLPGVPCPCGCGNRLHYMDMDDDGEVSIAIVDETKLLAAVMLPDDLRLCRLVEVTP